MHGPDEWIETIEVAIHRLYYYGTVWEADWLASTAKRRPHVSTLALAAQAHVALHSLKEALAAEGEQGRRQPR